MFTVNVKEVSGGDVGARGRSLAHGGFKGRKVEGVHKLESDSRRSNGAGAVEVLQGLKSN